MKLILYSIGGLMILSIVILMAMDQIILTPVKSFFIQKREDKALLKLLKIKEMDWRFNDRNPYVS